jgi:DNA-binding GntR family transcriptional regulator
MYFASNSLHFDGIGGAAVPTPKFAAVTRQNAADQVHRALGEKIEDGSLAPGEYSCAEHRQIIEEIQRREKDTAGALVRANTAREPGE